MTEPHILMGNELDIQSRIEQALRAVVEGEALAPNPAFPEVINERLHQVEATAREAVAQVPSDVQMNVQRLLGVAAQASSGAKRIMWLHRAAETAASAFGAHAACKPGCSHCCHIPVKISATEARALGKAIGRDPAPIANHQPVTIEGYEAPCPFLGESTCSIYAHRPTVCRTHLNLDVDELLCKLIPGQAVPVPYLDTRLFAMVSFQIEPNRQAWADIRQWFPSASKG